MPIALPPAGNDYGFYNAYVFKVKHTDLLTALQDNWIEIKKLADSLDEATLLYRYDTGKWNIKETLAHLCDAERNFCYRIMRISRKEQTPLPMYDINQFTINSLATERDIKGIMEELEIFRKATIIMFTNMPAAMLDLTGPARDVTISVRALGFAIVGHAMHHLELIRERYLKMTEAQ